MKRLSIVPAHISDERLEEYYLGRIGAHDTRSIIEGHLLVCERCEQRYRETSEFVDVMVAALSRLEDQQAGYCVCQSDLVPL
jgi:hypothetical protein